MTRKAAVIAGIAGVGAIGLIVVAFSSNTGERLVAMATARDEVSAVPAAFASRAPQEQLFARAVSRAAAPEGVRLVSDRAQAVHLEAGRMLIRTGELTLRVDTLDRALRRVREVASTVGAVVTGSQAEAGDGEHRSATIQLRVGAEQFDRAIEGLRRVGVEEIQRVQTQDVGEEYVDVAARVANGRRLESRLLNLLATRTGKLADIVAVEHELSNVREAIDALEGRRRYLESHVEQSTITVSLHEPFTIVGVAGPGVMQRAFEQSWENFVTVVAMGVRSIGVVVPLAILGLIAWTLARRYGREARASAALEPLPGP